MRSFENTLPNQDITDTNRIEDNKYTNQIEDNKDVVNSKEFLPKPVYFIESTNDSTVLVGIGVTIERSNINDRNVSKIRWYDTSHERAMTASETKQKDDLFAFKRVEQEGGGTYYFTPMNLDIYNKKVKRRLMGGYDFTSNEQLTEAFLSTLEDEI